MTRVHSYSPDRRTAVVLSGTGAHGAYHAGVLRALQEAGVKIDLVAGHGIGAANAAVAAIDGQARLWDVGGVWSSSEAAKLYEWRSSVRATGWLVLVLSAVSIAPFVAVLALGLVIYPLGFMLEMVGNGQGVAVIAAFSTWLQWAFFGPNLPTFVPRLGTFVFLALALLILVAALTARRAEHRARRSRGAFWWRVLGAPIDVDRARRMFASTMWQLIRGAAPPGLPSLAAIGRRYADVLSESLGQPGFREVVLIATDLDDKRDVVAALLREPFGREFIAARPNRDRRAEVLDLSDTGRDRALDIVLAALTPPVGCDAQLVTFPPASVWRGEVHRLCDRPGIMSRLLEEVAAAGVTQAIVVTATPSTSGPYQLQSSWLDVRHRLGEFVVAAESAAIRDALEMARLRFDAVHVIRPVHNAVGPFDAGRTYDESSDRRIDVRELVERGAEDAYRQFIEPVVGASGEHLARQIIAGSTGAGSEFAAS